MQDASYITLLESAGLHVEPDGTLTYDGYSFGRLNGDVVISGDTEASLEDISSIILNSSPHFLSLEFDSGRKLRILGINLVTGLSDQIVVGREIPLTLIDLVDEFETLFPDWGNRLYYDELKECEMMDMAFLGEPDRGVVPLCDSIVSEYHLRLQERLRELGYVGKRFPSVQVMDEALAVMIGRTRRNMFREWVESHDWDGKERLKHVFIDYLGAAAPSLRENAGCRSEKEDEYLEGLCEAWFLGAIARMYGPAKHEVVPVFIGEQGIGKGTVLRFLAGSDDWYAATTADVSRPNIFLESVRGAVIVEMGESKQIRNRSTQDDLKAFISQDTDRIRKPYARREEVYPRHFILAATSNDGEVFVDPTGSRRFYPVICDPDVCTKEVPVRRRIPKLQYEVEQIWAEALHLFKKGALPKASRIDKLARIVQMSATEIDPGAEAIDEWLDSMPMYSFKGARINRNIIVKEYFGVDNASMLSEYQLNRWKAWAKSTTKWQRAQSTIRVGGIPSSGFIRKADVGAEQVEIKTLNLVDDASREE